MQSYPIPLVPGPVSVPEAVRAAYAIDYGSADLEEEFFELYERCAAKLQTVLGASAQVTIQTGEGMLALWGALKSVVQPGDRVLAVGTGLFGYGIGDMARQIGAEVEVVGFPFDRILDPQPVREAAQRFRPKLVTAVHCETPSGTLNPLEELGQICREVDALFYVDFVASGGGVPVEVDRCCIDLGLLGSQKALSLPPDLSIVTVSERAWQAVAEVNYVGYDALAPWREGPTQRYLPYTHNWSALAALEISLDLLLAEGMEAVYARHATAAERCRRGLEALGIRLFPAEEAYNSPTVTAAYMPEGWSWPEFDRALRSHGMAVGGNYGELAGKVFRIGHMGSQANLALVERGLEVIGRVLAQKV
ncbi:MAG: aminotransferase class V-fold PLP-dependent enzyme [Caldilinea sp.]|nr:aminotransferase class V-fold PLP-dependent enzyme [Caldilinea sp.]MDW8440061.1 aminotransferase class V-fold PLP-dependent enzyme [Caldilineaceae bacterium]